jgi:hypothetical protein
MIRLELDRLFEIRKRVRVLLTKKADEGALVPGFGVVGCGFIT